MIFLSCFVIIEMYQIEIWYISYGPIIHHLRGFVKEKKNERSKGKLDEQARRAQREYLREWRRRNPDRVKEANRRYWEKRAARLASEKEAAECEN